MNYLLRQLYQYFDEIYLSASLRSDYRYLDFKQTVTTLLVLVGGLCLGMMIASILAVLQKKHVGKFVRALLDENAHDPEHAKSLADLGLSKNALIKMELSRSSVARKMIAVVDGEEVFDYYDELSATFPAYVEEIEARRKEEEEEAKAEALAQEEGVDEKDEEPSEGTEKRKRQKDPFMRSFHPRKLDFARVRFFIPEALRLRAEFRFQAKGNSWIAVVISFIVFFGIFLFCLRFIPFFVSMLDLSIGNILGAG